MLILHPDREMPAECNVHTVPGIGSRAASGRRPPHLQF